MVEGAPAPSPSIEQLSAVVGQMGTLLNNLAPALAGLGALPGLLEKLSAAPDAAFQAGATSHGQGSPPKDNNGGAPPPPGQ